MLWLQYAHKIHGGDLYLTRKFKYSKFIYVTLRRGVWFPRYFRVNLVGRRFMRTRRCRLLGIGIVVSILSLKVSPQCVNVKSAKHRKNIQVEKDVLCEIMTIIAGVDSGSLWGILGVFPFDSLSYS